MEETDMETVSRKKMKPASRYKKWLVAGSGAGFGQVYLAREGAKGGVPLSDMVGSVGPVGSGGLGQCGRGTLSHLSALKATVHMVSARTLTPSSRMPNTCAVDVYLAPRSTWYEYVQCT